MGEVLRVAQPTPSGCREEMGGTPEGSEGTAEQAAGAHMTDRCWALLDGLERGLRAHRHWLDTRDNA